MDALSAQLCCKNRTFSINLESRAKVRNRIGAELINSRVLIIPVRGRKNPVSAKKLSPLEVPVFTALSENRDAVGRLIAARKNGFSTKIESTH